MENTLSLSVKSPVVHHSFKPVVDHASRILILGSMPGPEALRKQQYYGFEGNHFWAIIPVLLGAERPSDYKERIFLLTSHGIALWDVLASCTRPGALDSAIRDPQPNPIPALLLKYRQIQAVFVNGRYAHTLFKKKFGDVVDRPFFYLPSSSPAHATMSFNEKTHQWGVIKKYLI